MSACPASPRRPEAGFSLVELMVALLIGLLGIVIMTHIYLTNDQYKRSTTAAGGANVNGAIALFTIERDLRMAGFGVNSSIAMGCICDYREVAPGNPGVPGAGGCSPVRYYYDAGTSTKYSQPPKAVDPLLADTRSPLSMFPVLITDFPVTNDPDQITIFAGGDNERFLGTVLRDPPQINFADDLSVDGTAGFEPGNLIVAVNQTATPFTCAMMQVSGITGTKLEHKSVNNAFGDFRKWNPPAQDLAPPFPTGTMLFNLGTPPTVLGTTPSGSPMWRSYGIRLEPGTNKNLSKLQLTDQLQVLLGGQSLDVAEDIVDLRAEYGKDTDGDGNVDLWTKKIIPEASPPATTLWTQTDWAGAPGLPNPGGVIAVRIAVLARNGEYVKPTTPGGACDATTALPTWAGSTVVAGSHPTASNFKLPDGLPSCYKYRVFETVVPLRNSIWRPE